MKTHRHSVVVATTGRRPALLTRALDSVLDQVSDSDRVIVVVDGAAKPDLDPTRPRAGQIELLTNRRTPGLSGALNTALDHLARSEEPDASWVSFLDDDDHWARGYLASVRAAIAATDVEVLAATLVRHDSETPDGRLQAPPASLLVEDFLRGNPGVQGSNLSATLSVLLRAGMFDEALPSCTDRDLCARLAELGARYHALTEARAHHDTLHGGSRLSDPENPAKHAGLEIFYAKWRPGMTAAVERTFLDRARDFFGWSPAPLALPASTVREEAPTNPVASSVTLVVGTIIDGARPDRALPLLDGLARLGASAGVRSLDVVLLENGSRRGFDGVVTAASRLGLRAWPVGLDAQRELAREHALLPTDLTDTKSIAVARTLLQSCVREVASRLPGAVAWIVDDDHRLPTDSRVLDHFVTQIARAKQAGFAVALGGNTGAAPVPSSSTIRVQLVDLAHFLHAAATHSPTDATDDPFVRNHRWRRARRDFYYDLARSETDRLETPFSPAPQDATWGTAVAHLRGRLRRILAGELVTRELPSVSGDVVAGARPSCLRGGNTFVFDLDLLRTASNMSPRVGERPIRRSDMLWAADAAHVHGRRVVAIPLALSHDRSSEPEDQDDSRRLVDDILGYGFFRAYEMLVRNKGALLDEGELDRLLHLTRKYVTERLAAARLAWWRTRGLVQIIRRLLDTSPWWTSTLGTEVAELVDAVDARFSRARTDAIEVAVSSGIDEMDIATFLRDRQNLATATFQAPARWLAEARRTRAAAIGADLGFAADEMLGMGAEGVVLRCEHRTLKVFDGLDRDAVTCATPHLRRLVGKETSSLPHVVAVHETQHGLVLECEYVESAPFEGSYGPGMYELLRELLALGLVHTNIHPKNLRRTARGLQLVDLGHSLEPATPVGEERMVRRAFLSWRFWFRSDLNELLHRSVDEEDFTELTGWRALLDALRSPHPKQVLDEAVLAWVERHGATSWLDYGCGKPRGQRRVRGLLAFDPDERLGARWEAAAPGVFVDERCIGRVLERAPFDAITCSLVLCTLEDGGMRDALARMRHVVRETGRVLVAVCDPTSCRVERTTSQTRVDPEENAYLSISSYTKRSEASGDLRTEVHRPLDAYRRAFATAGFAVALESIVDGTDLHRFERVPEFRLFELRPLARIEARTSLVIKACPMDAETLEAQVEHLVHQLARPRAFDEVIVALDPSLTGFVREHSHADLPGARAALDRLRRRGIVDRVVEAPTAEHEIAKVAERWFGTDCGTTHAANGQALVAFLSALDACTGDFVLHADVDTLVGRPDPVADFVREAIDAFDARPDALTLALPVPGDAPRVRDGDERGPFRVEAICGWIHKARAQGLRPLANEVRDGRFQLPWHRSLDRAVAFGKGTSLRLGSRAHWFAHPDNARKSKADDLLLLIDEIERDGRDVGRPRAAQVLGSPRSLQRGRDESMVLVVCGRNVGAGRIRRCLDSLAAQTFQAWGAIVIDDASDDGSDDTLKRECVRFGDRVTFVRRRRRVGLLANTHHAVRNLVARPEAAIVLVDLDDALGSTKALERVAEEHARGADVTVGSMVRTDKQSNYTVDFEAPRAKRGGAVWQHLRTFRKTLFDRIETSDLQDGASWWARATDWAFMLPIIEMAKRPVWIRESNYLHEPTDPRDAAARSARESVIRSLTSKPSYPRRRAANALKLTTLSYHRVLPDPHANRLVRVYRDRGMVVSTAAFEAQLRRLVRRYVPVHLGDVERAAAGEVALPENALLVTVDDGYRDFAEHAWPILQKLGIPSTVFVRAALDDGWPSLAPLDAIYADEESSERMKMRNWREAFLQTSVRDQLEAAHRVAANGDALRRSLYLHERTLREFVATGDLSIAMHGTEHVRWTLYNDGEFAECVTQAREWTVRMGGSGCSAAYPDGAVDARVAAALSRMGVRLGFALHDVPDVPRMLAMQRAVPCDDAEWMPEVDQ